MNKLIQFKDTAIFRMLSFLLACLFLFLVFSINCYAASYEDFGPFDGVYTQNIDLSSYNNPFSSSYYGSIVGCTIMPNYIPNLFMLDFGSKNTDWNIIYYAYVYNNNVYYLRYSSGTGAVLTLPFKLNHINGSYLDDDNYAYAVATFDTLSVNGYRGVETFSYSVRNRRIYNIDTSSGIGYTSPLLDDDTHFLFADKSLTRQSSTDNLYVRLGRNQDLNYYPRNMPVVVCDSSGSPVDTSSWDLSNGAVVPFVVTGKSDSEVNQFRSFNYMIQQINPSSGYNPGRPSEGSRARFNSFGSFYASSSWNDIYNYITVNEDNGTYSYNQRTGNKWQVSQTFFGYEGQYNWSGFTDNTTMLGWIPEGFSDYSTSQLAFSYYNGTGQNSKVSLKVHFLFPPVNFSFGGQDAVREVVEEYALHNACLLYSDGQTIQGGSFNNVAPGKTGFFKLDLNAFIRLFSQAYIQIDIVENNSTVLDSIVFRYNYGSKGDTQDVDPTKGKTEYKYVDGDQTDDMYVPDTDGNVTIPGSDDDPTHYQPSGNFGSLNPADLVNVLGQAVTTVSDFFQFAWSLFPTQIMTLIVANLTLIIVLRILGR